jgi:hypothetical protein
MVKVKAKMATNNKTVSLTFTESSETAQVSITDLDSNFSKTFSLPNSQVASLFSKDWSTGYFSVSQDGPIYIESRSGTTLIVVQRAIKENTSIRWGRDSPVSKTVTTPWCVGVFVVSTNSENNSYLKDSYMYTTTGPALGAFTLLKSAYWMGNVYRDHRICWGSSVNSSRESQVSLGSTSNFMYDFFNETFTSDLQTSSQLWESFTETGNNPGQTVGRLSSVLSEIWRTAL